MHPRITPLTDDDRAQFPAPTKRLLLVDDNLVLTEALDQVMQCWSFATSTAATVKQAQNVVLKEEPFTFIVCDYFLPDGNGLEFLEWMRQSRQNPVPFLLISGGVLPGSCAAHDYAFLAKPFLMEEFYSRLEGLRDPLLQPAVTYSLSPMQEAAAAVYARSRAVKPRRPEEKQ